MEMMKNIASGEYFIFFEDDPGVINFLLVKPKGKNRQVEKHLFGRPNIVDRKISLWSYYSTELQLQKYAEFSTIEASGI